jgi:hypothetical protein
VRRALSALVGAAVGKDTGSRVWRKAKSDWVAWNARSLADEPIVRLNALFCSSTKSPSNAFITRCARVETP